MARNLHINFFLLKIYGAAVTFFELLPEEQLTEERKNALKLNDDEVRSTCTSQLIIQRVILFYIFILCQHDSEAFLLQLGFLFI